MDDVWEMRRAVYDRQVEVRLRLAQQALDAGHDAKNLSQWLDPAVAWVLGKDPSAPEAAPV